MDTTVTIDKETANRLDKLSKIYSCSKKAFLNASLIYFEKQGINPLSHESPSKEMEKLIKRVDSIVGFIRTQEKEFQRPALEAILTSEERITQYLSNIENNSESTSQKVLFQSMKEQEITLSEIKKYLSDLSDKIDDQSKKKKGLFS